MSTSTQPPRLPRQVGEIIVVRAWWKNPPGQHVKCKIEHVYHPVCMWADKYTTGFYEVKQVDLPGAHLRWVEPKDVL